MIKKIIFFTIPFLTISISLLQNIYAEKSDGNLLSLDDAIEEAILYNPLLKESKEKSEAAKSEYNGATVDLLPKFSTSYSYTRFMDYPYMKLGLDFPGLPEELPVSEKDVYKWDVTLIQPIFTGFALISKRELAKLGVNIGKLDMQLCSLHIIQNVKNVYFGILIKKLIYEVSLEEVKLLELHLKDAENFFEQGLISNNDLLKTKVSLANAKLKKEKNHKNYIMTIEGMNILLNRPLNSHITVIDVNEPSRASYNQSELIRTALKQRPEVKILSLAIKKSDMAIMLARSRYYPEILLLGRYEKIGENPLATKNTHNNDHNASISIIAKYKFFEWGKSTFKVDNAIHIKNSIIEKLKFLKRTIANEVKNAILDIEVANKNISTSKKALEQAKENFRIVDIQYKQQMTTSTEVLDATTFLSSAKINYFSTLYGYRTSLAKLEKAIGKIKIKSD